MPQLFAAKAAPSEKDAGAALSANALCLWLHDIKGCCSKAQGQHTVTYTKVQQLVDAYSAPHKHNETTDVVSPKNNYSAGVQAFAHSLACSISARVIFFSSLFNAEIAS